jgi:hypothetical protein
MKRYTIIFGVPVGRGNMHATAIKFDRVETNNLKSLIEQDKYCGNVAFIFEGWPILEGEFDIPVPAPAVRRVNILGTPKV